MLWFKHIANTTSDPELMTGILRFGSDAYYVFFETLEILTKEEVFDAPKEFDFKFFKTFFPHISSPKLRRILEYFNNCRENAGKMPRISAEVKPETLILFCDKLSRLSWSYNKKLGKKMEKTSKYRREKKEERRKKKNIQDPPAGAGVSVLSDSLNEKKKFAESVYMTEKEFEELCLKVKDKSKVARAIEILDNYKVSKGRKYKSDYRAILSWVLDKIEEEIKKGKFKPAGAPALNPLIEKKMKIDAIISDMNSKTFFSEVEAFKKYNEETRQSLNRGNISELEAKYFAEFITKHYPK